MITVLVIEDDYSTRLVTKLHLKNEYNVVEASNGVEALEKLEHQKADLVIAATNDIELNRTISRWCKQMNL